MFNQLLCAYVAEGVRQLDLAVVKPLSEIISDIRSPAYQETVQAIQSSDDDESHKLKLSLPAFYPALKSISSLEPTGIIQFDIDVKSNSTLDMDVLAASLRNHPSTVYLFKSPRKGLKFGILTDFKNEENNNTDLLKKRFEFCYEDVLGHLSDLDGIQDFTPDKATSSIKQACFYSYDPDAYLNELAEPLVVNDLIPDVSIPEYASEISLHSAISDASSEFVEKLLNYIPKNYSYHDRMPINYAVCYSLGTEAGKRLLINHWSKPANVLIHQIDSQMKYLKSSSIGVLINEAKEHGYRDTTGRARKTLEPKSSNVQLEPLLNAEQATEKLDTLIQDFYTNKLNTYVSISVGAGKTKAVIDSLVDIATSGKKVLYLVSNHKLGGQVEHDLVEEIKKRKSTYTSFCRERFKYDYKKLLIRIRGKSFQQKSDDEQLLWFDESIGEDEGYLCTGSEYIEQFTNTANIRIMTHHELFNYESAWVRGVKYKLTKNIELPNGELIEDYEISKSTSGNYWKPDYIIIDEDIIQIDNEIMRSVEGLDATHESIKLILHGLKHGKSLEELLFKYVLQINSDSQQNYPTNGSGKNRKPNPKYSEILYCLNKYIESLDKDWLDGIHYIGGELHINRLKRVAERYKNTPTLILDATANEKVVNHVFPTFKFERIAVMANKDFNIYQMCNANFTKKSLGDEKNRAIVKSGLKSLVDSYENVGLITYKSINGSDNFCEELASSLGITLFAHFGNLRGLNLFKDVDCLLVVGRYSIPVTENKKLAAAIFNKTTFSDGKRMYLDKIVRMKSGEVKLLNNQIDTDELLAATYEHKSIAETIQAIGRGRPNYSKKKDIFLFSNESLGADIEITEFFRYEKYFQERILDESIIRHLLDIGYVEKSRKGIAKVLLEAGLKVSGNIENYVKNHKEEIETELSLAGFRPTPSKSKYLVSDMLRFESIIH